MSEPIICDHCGSHKAMAIRGPGYWKYECPVCMSVEFDFDEEDDDLFWNGDEWEEPQDA